MKVSIGISSCKRQHNESRLRPRNPTSQSRILLCAIELTWIALLRSIIRHQNNPYVCWCFTIQCNPDFFCYGKYKNDNIIMVILLRIVDNSTTCWLELRTFHGQQNYLITNVDGTTKDAGKCVGCGFLFPTTCGVDFVLCLFDLLLLECIFNVANLWMNFCIV